MVLDLLFVVIDGKCMAGLTQAIAGVDVTANQEEISNHETFQLEFDPKAAKWAIRTMQDKYFR